MPKKSKTRINKKPSPKKTTTASKIVKLERPAVPREVKEYTALNGKNYFKEWFEELAAPMALKVMNVIKRVEAGNLTISKSVGEGVHEIKLYNPALRIYFGKDGAEIIMLLSGGSKKGQAKDIEKAKELWKEYKKTKKNK